MPSDSEKVEKVSDLLAGSYADTRATDWLKLGTPIMIPPGHPYIGKQRMYVKTERFTERDSVMMVVSQEALSACGCGAKRGLRAEAVAAVDMNDRSGWIAWLCPVHLDQKRALESRTMMESCGQANVLLAFSDEELETELKRRRGDSDGANQDPKQQSESQ